MRLKVSTFNIMTSALHYEQRSQLIKAAIEEMDSDILGLQEIDYTGNQDILNLPNYKSLFSPSPEPLVWDFHDLMKIKIDGNCILLKPHVKNISEGFLTYESNNRVAQRVKIRMENTEIWIVNTHLDENIQSEDTRYQQSLQLLEWMSPYLHFPIIITGDFNMLPDSDCYNLYTRTFKSAYHAMHSEEPEVTWPTEMLGPKENWESHGQAGCYDYIFFKNLDILDAKVINHIRKDHLCPSDHYPIEAIFSVPNN